MVKKTAKSTKSRSTAGKTKADVKTAKTAGGIETEKILAGEKKEKGKGKNVKKVAKLTGAAGRKAEFEKRMRISQKFAARLIEKFKRTVKSVVVFGSTARGAAKKESDIDIFVILDDTKIEKEIPAEIKDRIWNEILNIAKDISSLIAVQSFMFITEFWESLRVAEPVTLAVLRDGIPVFDVGVFMPAKRMLQRGNIPTTREAVDKKITAAPQFVEYAESRVKSAAHYMEQAMAAAGNAVLMFIGRVPQNKEKVPDELEEYFVKENLLEKKYVEEARSIIKFAKDIEHEKVIPNIGAETDKHLKMTQEFVKRMQILIKELEMRKKTSILMKTYKTFLKANVGALRYIGIKPPEELKDLPKTIYEHFPELKELHADLFGGLAKALTMVKEGKGEFIPEREVYALREKTKAFVIGLGQKLKEMKEAGKIKPLPEEEEKAEGKEKKGKAEKVEKEMPLEFSPEEMPPAAKDRPEAALVPEDHIIEKLGGEAEEGIVEEKKPAEKTKGKKEKSEKEAEDEA